MKISDLMVNREARINLLMTDVAQKIARNGKPYCTLTLTDGEKQIVANVWNTTAEAMEKFNKTVVEVDLSLSLYNGNNSYTVAAIAPAKNANLGDFIRKAPLDSQQMYDEIIEAIKNTHLSITPLVLAVYEDNHDKLMYWSAAKAMHHDFYGGLLYHTVEMLRLAKACSPMYHGEMNDDMLVLGVVMHDIGKLRELNTDALGVAEYTVEGQMLQHLLLGVEIVNEYAQKIPCNEEELALLKHIISSHHGKREFGAITIPATPEAYLVHLLDMMSSHLNIFFKVYADLEDGTCSAPIAALDGVRVYKPTC
jgi:3'-5' exoribonuclease